MNDLKIWKMILEIRYPAAATLFDSRGKIAAKWQWTSDLTEWQISNNQVSIHNKTNTTFLNTGFRNTSVVIELPENYKAFCNQASEFSVWVLETLQVKKIERIGLRIIQVAKRQHFKLLLSKMRESLLALTDDDWNILGGQPEDIAMPLTLALGSNRANFNIGPMRVEQLATFFEAKEVKDKLPSVALFLDFDLYKDDPDFSPETYREQLDNFLRVGSEQILDISSKLVDRYGGFA
jgi:hypothetical protein